MQRNMEAKIKVYFFLVLLGQSFSVQQLYICQWNLLCKQMLTATEQLKPFINPNKCSIVQ
jgi:hypothetical protein